MGKLLKRVHAFFFEPASAEPIAAVRIGLASLLLVQAYLCASLFFDWYGTDGLLQRGVTERFAWGIPQTTKIADWLGHFGLSEHSALLVLAGIYLVALVAFLVGWHTRIAAVVTLVFHTLFTQQHLTSYGFDVLSQIALFYCVWTPCGHAWSLDVQSGRVSNAPTNLTRLALRVWQLHLALVYLASGLEKAMGPQWWNGEAIWRSLMLPIYRQADFHFLAWLPWAAKIIGWSTLLIETGYPLFIFWPRTRKLWMVAIVGMHVGIGLFLGLHLFGALMALFTLAIFGVAPATQLVEAPNSESVRPPLAAYDLTTV